MTTTVSDELAGCLRSWRERTLAWRHFMGFPSIRVLGSPQELAEDEEALVAELQGALNGVEPAVGTARRRSTRCARASAV